MAQKTSTIRQTDWIPGATPEQVYQALMDSKKHSSFTGARATCDARPGGAFTAWDGYISGTNLDLEPGRRIVQEWITTEWPEGSPPSRLEWTFAALDGGVEATLAHSGVPASQLESYRQGWIDYYWEPLKRYFRRKAGAR